MIYAWFTVRSEIWIYSNAAVGHGFHPSPKGAFSPSRAKYIKSVSSSKWVMAFAGGGGGGGGGGDGGGGGGGDD